jgi:hypothetical protein
VLYECLRIYGQEAESETRASVDKSSRLNHNSQVSAPVKMLYARNPRPASNARLAHAARLPGLGPDWTVGYEELVLGRPEARRIWRLCNGPQTLTVTRYVASDGVASAGRSSNALNLQP